VEVLAWALIVAIAVAVGYALGRADERLKLQIERDEAAERRQRRLLKRMRNDAREGG
jgi:uncharacterized membrane protein